jgi:hypothetical protein
LNLAGIPRLAIGRAHKNSVAWRPNSTITKNIRGSLYSLNTNSRTVATGGGVFDYGVPTSRWSGSYLIGDDRAFWSVPAHTFDSEKIAKDAQGNIRNFNAMTPLIPLPLRPKHKLDNYFILWEANWHPEPPRDPYLLRPLAGSLMEIIAEWDLTPLEIAAVKNAARTN